MCVITYCYLLLMVDYNHSNTAASVSCPPEALLLVVCFLKIIEDATRYNVPDTYERLASSFYTSRGSFLMHIGNRGFNLTSVQFDRALL